MRSAQTFGQATWLSDPNRSIESVQKFIKSCAKVDLRREWTSKRDVLDSIVLLDSPSAPRLDMSKGVRLVTHANCGRSTLGTVQTTHRCGVLVAPQPAGPRANLSPSPSPSRTRLEAQTTPTTTDFKKLSISNSRVRPDS